MPTARRTGGTVFVAVSSADYLSNAGKKQKESFPHALPDDLRPVSAQVLARINASEYAQLISDKPIQNYSDSETVLTGSGVRDANNRPSIIVWCGSIHKVSATKMIATCGTYEHGLAASCEVIEFRKVAGRWLAFETLYGYIS
jgi:hypothetical protein